MSFGKGGHVPTGHDWTRLDRTGNSGNRSGELETRVRLGVFPKLEIAWTFLDIRRQSGAASWRASGGSFQDPRVRSATACPEESHGVPSFRSNGAPSFR